MNTTNTLIFLAGSGAGATTATILLILAMKAWSQKTTENAKELRENNRANTDALIERNDIGRDQVTVLNHIAKLLCQHRNVTVADISTCDDCGSVVDYDKEARNWK